MGIFRRKSLKEENTRLAAKNEALERELDATSSLLNDFTTKKSLGRLIEIPRKIGDTVYVLMKASAYPGYNSELIGMRRSDTVPENNIKIIAITIVGYVIQPSGTYIAFREQYEEDIVYHININSENLFLTMDAAIGEMYSSSCKKKYMNNPFVVLQQEDVLNVVNNSASQTSALKSSYESNNIII